MPSSAGRTTQIYRTLKQRETAGDAPAIEFEDVSFTIGGHHVLDRVSFRIMPGQNRIILGPSGIGKSTILRLILGLFEPQGGDIRIFGRSMVHSSQEKQERIRKKIGMVFQNGALFDSMTVGENVGYGMIENTKQSYEEIDPQVRQFLYLVGLDADFVIDRLPDELSVGMQRRVSIARALAFNEPDILLYDEPTTGLDPVSVETVTDVILRLRQELGVTGIIVTHELPHALKVADDFLFLYDRKIAFEGKARDLAESKVPSLVKFLHPFRISLHQAYESFSEEGGGK